MILKKSPPKTSEHLSPSSVPVPPLNIFPFSSNSHESDDPPYQEIFFFFFLYYFFSFFSTQERTRNIRFRFPIPPLHNRIPIELGWEGWWSSFHSLFFAHSPPCGSLTICFFFSVCMSPTLAWLQALTSSFPSSFDRTRVYFYKE